MSIFYRGRHRARQDSVAVADLLTRFDWYLPEGVFVLQVAVERGLSAGLCAPYSSAVCTGARRVGH